MILKYNIAFFSFQRKKAEKEEEKTGKNTGKLLHGLQKK